MEGTTQSNPADMLIYAIVIIPMILIFVELSLQKNYNAFTAALADCLTTAGPTDQLKKCWDEPCRFGPKFGCYTERSKSWLVNTRI